MSPRVMLSLPTLLLPKELRELQIHCSNVLFLKDEPEICREHTFAVRILLNHPVPLHSSTPHPQIPIIPKIIP